MSTSGESSKNRPGQGPGILPRDAVALAVGTLTILPTPVPTAVNRRVAGWAMVLGPVVVLPITLVAALVGWLLGRAGAPGLAVGMLTVGLVLAGTRAIHADGLADTVDGLGAASEPDRALEIMRRGDVGPMGAVALVVVTGLQAACVGDVLTGPGARAGVGSWLCAAALLAASRAALASGARVGVPAARPEGLGEAVAGSVPWLRWLGCWAATLLLVLLAAMAGARSAPLLAGGVLAAASAVEGALAFVRSRLGGITGDVLGALVEVAACVLLLAAALC